MAIITLKNNSLSSVTELPSGISGQNYPAFEAYLSSSQSISDAVRTTINVNTEHFDTDGCYDTGTYRFTPNVAGKYFCYANALLDAVGTSNLNLVALYFLKNSATTVAERLVSFQSNPAQYFNAPIYKVIEFNGTTDYIVFQAYIDDISGTPSVGGNATDSRTNFGAYRIGD